MFEYRIFAPGKATAFKTTYFYGREPRFEQAWDAIAVYALNDSRWKDDPNVLKNIAGVDKIIGDKDFEAWFPFGYTPEDHLGDLGPFWPDSDVFPHLAIGGGP